MIKDFIKKQLSLGRYSFSIQEAEKACTTSSRGALLAALERLARKKEVISPIRGFYLIVPPEFSLAGCLPPDQVTTLLMTHWHTHYYVGLLSAAHYYGAGHQQPQIFQVMLAKNRTPISCGRTKIVFIARKNLQIIPTQTFKTPRGPIIISTPEASALDLVTYPHQCGGWNQVTTVLQELVEHIKIEPLIELAQKIPETAWVQRLGYLFFEIGAYEISSTLERILQYRQHYFKPLDTQKSIKGFIRDPKWRLIINTKIETDL